MRSLAILERSRPAVLDNKIAAYGRAGRLMPAVVVLSMVFLLILGGLTSDAFLSFQNGLTILRAASITGIVAVGMTFITLSGNLFALSLEQTAALSATIFALSLRGGWSLWTALLFVAVSAVLVGVAQGVVVARGASPILATLGAGAILIGLASQLTNGRNIRFNSNAADWIGGARPLGIPTQTWAFLVVAAVAWWVCRYTVFGRQVYLLGSNKNTSRGTGVRVGRIMVITFVMAAVAAAVAGVFVASQFAQVKIEDFSGAVTNLDKGGTNINVIAAVLIGGVTVQGGQGSPLMAAMGAIFIATLQNYMHITGVPIGLRYAITGTLVALVVVILHVSRRR